MHNPKQLALMSAPLHPVFKCFSALGTFIGSNVTMDSLLLLEIPIVFICASAKFILNPSCAGATFVSPSVYPHETAV